MIARHTRALATVIAACIVAASFVAPATQPQAQAQDLASQAQDLASQVQRNIDAALRDFAALNPLPAGSSVPGIGGGAPVGNGRDGEHTVAGRSYLIWVPHNYNPARPTPLVVAFSAFQDSAEGFREYSRLRESAVGRNAIIVYPRAIGAAWEGSPRAKTEPGQDIRFVRAVVADVQRRYHVDHRRIYATGMSNGGGMAAVSACHMPDIFAGVAAVAGAYYEPVNQNCASEPVAFLAIHGMADPITPYYGGRRWGVKQLPVPEMFQSYERRNRCAGGVDREPAGHGVTRVSARGCVKGVEVLQYHGAQHTWMSAPSPGDEMWAFLSRHSK